MRNIFNCLQTKNQKVSGKVGFKHLKNFIVAGILMSLPVICAGYAAASSVDNDKPSKSRGHELRIAILPNEITYAGQAKIDTIRSINQHHTDFNIFTGDTKNGSTMCTDDAIGQDIVDYFNQLNAPTLYSVGDNEWTDCHRTSNGSYDPIERLSYIRQIFFSKSSMQGPDPIRVERQGELGKEYSENSRFIRSNVLFVALHIVGSNNNLVATEDQCTHKSNRTEADCDAATAEYMARNIADKEWLKASFQEAREKHLAGIVIAIQGDIYFPFELGDGHYWTDFWPQLNEDNGFTDFFRTLVTETQNFQGQVLLIHGDTHYLTIDKAMYPLELDQDGNPIATDTVTSNFTRVMTFGDREQSWVEMIVDPKGESLFRFVPVILKPLTGSE